MDCSGVRRPTFDHVFLHPDFRDRGHVSLGMLCTRRADNWFGHRGILRADLLLRSGEQTVESDGARTLYRPKALVLVHQSDARHS